jgi:peroxiredoxin Q/BCP
MAQLRQDYEKFQDAGAEILVIGPDNQEKFLSYWDEHQLPFPGLPDPEHSVLKLYGQEIKLFKFGRMPAMVIVDRKGTARFVHYGHNMQDIPDNLEVLEIIKDM